MRRKFYDINKASDKSEKGLLANFALGKISEIYGIEANLKDRSLEEILSIRQETTKPIFKELKSWVIEVKEKVPPKSLIGKAISYIIGQSHKLEYFLEDPRVGPYTDIVENAIRSFAVGRKTGSLVIQHEALTRAQISLA